MNILSLPDELLLEIAYYNGLPTIKLLCCTNRRLHRALEPLIYCDVDLTHVATPRIQEFIENISDKDHRKATFIHSLHLDYAFRFPAFDLLPNLRRLSVIEERGLPFTESWASLQTNSTLTHLVWLNQIFDEKAFASFLNAQPHLRYLKVENLGDYHGGPYHWAQFVSPNALGRLSTLSTCVRAAHVILPNRTIPHLELIFGTDDRGVFILPPESDSEVVQTLALSNSGRQELVLTALQFPNLQQLQVYPRFSYRPVEDLLGGLQSLSSLRRLTYVLLVLESGLSELYKTPPNPDDSVKPPVDLQKVIEGLPNLRVLDIQVNQWLSREDVRPCPSRCYRYARNMAGVSSVDIQGVDRIGAGEVSWWQNPSLRMDS